MISTIIVAASTSAAVTSIILAVAATVTERIIRNASRGPREGSPKGSRIPHEDLFAEAVAEQLRGRR